MNNLHSLFAQFKSDIAQNACQCTRSTLKHSKTGSFTA